MTDLKPTPLKPVRLQPRKDVIEILETALARAKSGEMRGVCLTAELTGERINFVASFSDGVLVAGHLATQIALATNAMLHTNIPAAAPLPAGADVSTVDDDDSLPRGMADSQGSVPFGEE